MAGMGLAAPTAGAASCPWMSASQTPVTIEILSDSDIAPRQDHIKAIYRKTGVGARSDLSSLVSGTGSN